MLLGDFVETFLEIFNEYYITFINFVRSAHCFYRFLFLYFTKMDKNVSKIK